MKRYLVVDCETYSELDLKRAGPWEYSKHKSTEILCVSFSIGTKEELAAAPIFVWVPSDPNCKTFPMLLKALRDESIDLVAHNAFFEQCIFKNVFGPRHMPSKPELQRIQVERWHCTAARARSVGLPGGLDLLCRVLNTKNKKDAEGHKIMLKLCKPKKASKKDPSTRNRDPELFKRMVAYCVQDTAAEKELFLRIPDLRPIERKFWILNQKTNLRGFAVDRALCLGALKLIARESVRMDAEVYRLTKGQLNSARQRNAVLKFLKAQAWPMADLKGDTVQKELLRTDLKNPLVRAILEIRLAIAKSSTAKYAAFEIRSRSDGRARDNTIFFGAHTGREAGTGLQPQNLFKTVLPQRDVEVGLELMKRADADTIEALYPKPMELYASALRSCIIAAPGHTLDVGDFATIEVRVLFWLAGNQGGLDALASGRDLYIEMAARIYGLKADKLAADYKAGSDIAKRRRQLGKQTILGAGFGIGVGGEKFQATCAQYGIDITLDLAQTAIRTYRALHPRIPIFWTNIERAAVLACQNPGKSYKLGYLTWKKEGDFLTCQLPIGRKISYFKPEVSMVKGAWGIQPKLSYLGQIAPKVIGRITTWGGKLAENVTQGVARDCLKEKLLALHEEGRSLPVLEVHDEAVGERKDGVSSNEAFVATMSVVPAWAKGLPIKVEGWSERRYRK